MKNVLITGATGNIGSEVIHYLNEIRSTDQIFAGVRNLESAKAKFQHIPTLQYRIFDFENSETYQPALHNIQLLFLLRPPQIADVDTFFKPLLETAKSVGVQQIIFLSVQGAEKSKMIPHYKIEKLILKLNFKYIFIRPSYFMQNLTTTLLPEIKTRKQITLPSGKAKFNWVDVKNIGENTAICIHDFNDFKNQALEITGKENKNFFEVTEIMSRIIGEEIRFRSVNPISFYIKKRREGMPKEFVLVMLILHFLPRFQKVPKLSNAFQKITGKQPTSLEEFIKRERDVFLGV
ncbi:NmrA family NAD(P)-binding protein [Galbibacter mesophilus]|uniref:NmrA family NAD(P)-binding protein n=1 Tax=Galbibacter mesophilus TaxID=379069 RepID=UPI00191F7E1E|nr:NmrA family NAD(P)-binding protein [Galbibacter mesophilus]MCM5661650.1 NmrA family NAD(P)-binding protein [Galbibacter mesophilus]